LLIACFLCAFNKKTDRIFSNACDNWSIGGQVGCKLSQINRASSFITYVNCINPVHCYVPVTSVFLSCFPSVFRLFENLTAPLPKASSGKVENAREAITETPIKANNKTQSHINSFPATVKVASKMIVSR